MCCFSEIGKASSVEEIFMINALQIARRIPHRRMLLSLEAEAHILSSTWLHYKYIVLKLSFNDLLLLCVHTKLNPLWMIPSGLFRQICRTGPGKFTITSCIQFSFSPWIILTFCVPCMYSIQILVEFTNCNQGTSKLLEKILSLKLNPSQTSSMFVQNQGEFTRCWGLKKDSEVSSCSRGGREVMQ